MFRTPWTRFVVTAAVVVVTVGTFLGYLALTGRPSPLRPLLAATANKVTRTSGTSAVQSDLPGYPVTLRDCDIPQGAGAQQGCIPIDELQNGTLVQMRCWEDTRPPVTLDPQHEYTSPRWFFVNEVTGPHPGQSGYIYSALIPVANQILTPRCTPSITDEFQNPKITPQPIPKAPLRFSVTGTCTTAGGTLTGVSSGFTPGGEYLIEAEYSDGRSYPLNPAKAIRGPDGTIALPGTVASNGTITWIWPCQGDPPGTYRTVIIDGQSGRQTDWVSFTIGSAPTSTPNNPPPPTATPTSPPPPPTSAPTAVPTAPQPPPTAQRTYSETAGGVAHTWSNYTNAGGSEGPTIAAFATVQIACKLQGFRVQNGNTWWYRIAQSPWNNKFYVSADAFYNNGRTSGPLQGTPYVDLNVPNC